MDWRDGLLVEVAGRLDVYGPRGELQLIVEAAQGAGQGDLFEQFMRLKGVLEAEGCFDPTRKRPQPAYPASIAVVTSLDAAALRDVATTLRRRVPHLPVRVFPSPVQGEAAPAALCDALERAYRSYRETGQGEVLLLVRGGGSLEDLWAFNSPLLVRKIMEAPMPVICGVGHETDFTLADLTADVRAPTPTAAAELCAPSRESQHQALEAMQRLLSHRTQRQWSQQAQRIDRLAAQLGRPMERLSRERERFWVFAHRMQQALQRRSDHGALRLQQWPADFHAAGQRHLKRQHDHLAHMEARLRLLDPMQVLQRGYALLTDEYGHAVTSVRQLTPSQHVVAQLADGQADLTVKSLGV
jgi:exodeoxyribonuclease VII large subunit